MFYNKNTLKKVYIALIHKNIKLIAKEQSLDLSDVKSEFGIISFSNIVIKAGLINSFL